MNLSKFLADKKVGFWFSVSMVVLLVLCGILYIVMTPSMVEFTNFALKTVNQNVLNFVGYLPIIGAVILLVLLVLKQYSAAQYTGFGVALLSFLLYIYVAYRYVFEWFLDIEVHELASSFIILTIFFVITLLIAITNVFLKQTKAVEGVTANE